MDTETLLEAPAGAKVPSADEFKELIVRLDQHRVLAKVFLLEGVPHVFEKSPMKYVIFREQVADRFGVGSQDVCIVGSAKLGYSPSPHRYGMAFSEQSDVDVVVISQPLFYEGSRELFSYFNRLDPPVHKIRPFLTQSSQRGAQPPVVPLENWKDVKEGIRNFTFENFNPGLLPDDNHLRRDIFGKKSAQRQVCFSLLSLKFSCPESVPGFSAHGKLLRTTTQIRSEKRRMHSNMLAGRLNPTMMTAGWMKVAHPRWVGLQTGV